MAPRFVCVCVLLTCVRVFATPWTAACQALLSMNSPDKNTGVDCHFLLQGIFLTQALNPGLLLCRQILYHLSYRNVLWYQGMSCQLKKNFILAISKFATITNYYDYLLLLDGSTDAPQFFQKIFTMYLHYPGYL